MSHYVYLVKLAWGGEVLTIFSKSFTYSVSRWCISSSLIRRLYRQQEMDAVKVTQVVHDCQRRVAWCSVRWDKLTSA